MNRQDGQPRLAVLIDADNTQASIIEGLLEEVANYGIASVKRIYGDWTNPSLKGWKELLNDYSIQPIQQFAYTRGKNATDSAMIIDAMDILYSDRVDGFCIVSSDSDFTRLSARIREAGLPVYGFGEEKTPKPFVRACDKFTYTEVLRKEEKDDVQETQKRRKGRNELKMNTRLVNLVRNAVEDSEDEYGWAHLAIVGQNISNKSSEFDPRNYGYKKLGELIKAMDLFDIDERQAQNSPGKEVFIRDKRKR